MERTNWTREELILAFNLYCKIPFGTIHHRNPRIIALAKLLGRTPSAVAWKLANLASLDSSLRRRNIAGASHASQLDQEVWNEFTGNWERLAFESERLLAKMQGRPIELAAEIETDELPRSGKERRAEVMLRVNQSFFRKAVLASYGETCCVTGLTFPTLLVASHIVPWSKDEANRVNPRNGLCLNALLDRAFDTGLITVTTDFRVKISTAVRDAVKDTAKTGLLTRFHGKQIKLPDKFLPVPEFIRYHNVHIFRGK
ncbi:MAG TPA: HNH endonuclease [Anaerolineales bacterium]